MKQLRFFLIIISVVLFTGVISCSETNVAEVDATFSTPPTEEVINPDIAAQQFCDCSTLPLFEKETCYNNWITTYRNNTTAISQAKQMTLKMVKCNPKDALEIVEKLMIGGAFVSDTASVIDAKEVVTLDGAAIAFCSCIALPIIEKEACLNNWILKYKNASGSQSEGVVLQNKMRQCSEDDAKATWNKLLEK